ncbi:meiotic nuclear division protein 1 homolog isoform X1 [Tursiops truncatus]|uniref:meiotic nuclear division protein 1 homolog isoform X1 n=1 Tax=Tursiops truncatus TaxID=9739 RepID=UPI003CCF30DD
MSKKKGLSAEEKRARMMEIFFETKDVFQLKDMEKIAPKEKGITAMSVKEVLQSLVDDGMVDCERIGTSNYYWAFPSKALHARKRKLEVLESQLSEVNQKHANLQKSIEKARIGRHETEERTLLAKELSSLRDQREQLKAEVEKYKECDPQVVEEIRQANEVAKEAANRWTGLSLLWPLPLWSTGSGRTSSAAMAHGPSRSAACGIFPDRDTNPHPLHRQADSQPLRHQGNPLSCTFN